MTNTEIVPRRADRADREPPGRPPLVDAALADELLARAQSDGVELLGPAGLLSQVTKAVLERALGEEMSQHLGYDKHDPAGRGSGNSRNGSSGKRLLTDIGGIDLDVPRDRNGSFAPQIVRKGQTRLDGFNDRIIALYARGLSTRDIRAHLREMYDVDLSPDLTSRVTDAVLEELQEWQSRPLDRGQFLAVVANQEAMRWWCHRAMSCRGDRSPRHSRGRSLSSSATSRARSSVTRPRSVLLGASVFVKRLNGASYSRLWRAWEVTCPKSWRSGLSQPRWISESPPSVLPGSPPSGARPQSWCARCNRRGVA